MSSSWNAHSLEGVYAHMVRSGADFVVVSGRPLTKGDCIRKPSSTASSRQRSRVHAPSAGSGDRSGAGAPPWPGQWQCARGCAGHPQTKRSAPPKAVGVDERAAPLGPSRDRRRSGGPPWPSCTTSSSTPRWKDGPHRPSNAGRCARRGTCSPRRPEARGSIHNGLLPDVRPAAFAWQGSTP